MQNVTVPKARLLETLKTNRDQHRQQFLDAQVAYREKVIEVLESRLKEAREGSKIRAHLSMPEPRDYTDHYDRAIQMVEWEVSDEIELDEHDFKRYVLNDWEWAPQFAATSLAYTTPGAMNVD